MWKKMCTKKLVHFMCFITALKTDTLSTLLENETSGNNWEIFFKYTSSKCVYHHFSQWILRDYKIIMVSLLRLLPISLLFSFSTLWIVKISEFSAINKTFISFCHSQRQNWFVSVNFLTRYSAFKCFQHWIEKQLRQTENRPDSSRKYSSWNYYRVRAYLRSCTE